MDRCYQNNCITDIFKVLKEVDFTLSQSYLSIDSFSKTRERWQPYHDNACWWESTLTSKPVAYCCYSEGNKIQIHCHLGVSCQNAQQLPVSIVYRASVFQPGVVQGVPEFLKGVITTLMWCTRYRNTISIKHTWYWSSITRNKQVYSYTSADSYTLLPPL